MQLVKDTIKSPEVIRFVRHLLRHISGPICLFWDNNTPHKSKLTRETLAGFAPRLSVYRLPPYAPELNPDEGVWGHLKCHALRGFCPPDLNVLINTIRRETKRMRQRPALIRSLFDDCPLFLPSRQSN
jgi:transposase